ncbi:uncharacterized protein J3R85_004459 [Psidium guajava]|nr:uncharacterized protein J3R85_004459 [Psidium guajava]
MAGHKNQIKVFLSWCLKGERHGVFVSFTRLFPFLRLVSSLSFFFFSFSLISLVLRFSCISQSEMIVCKLH